MFNSIVFENLAILVHFNFFTKVQVGVDIDIFMHLFLKARFFV